MTNRTDGAAFDRILRFEAIHNVRDLGGIPAPGGRRTRPRVALRAATLLAATPADREQLKRLGVSRVFDLRSFPELAREGFADLRDVGAEREHVPIFRDTEISPEALAARRKLYASDFSLAYLRMLREGAPSIRRIVEAVAEARGPLLFHCAGGKDRTGVVSAVLLLLAGVAPELIAEDYGLTAAYLPAPPEERVLSSMARMGLDRVEFMEMLSARPPAMLRTIERLHAESGSVEQYLRTTGLAPDVIEAARERLLDSNGT
ncbi:MAG TPA: tyrosine-protein phosphatase [Dehalococcoidia bacterium]|nr:tyrosine-protein phosphatase [Dehalococcoidia bacterium]